MWTSRVRVTVLLLSCCVDHKRDSVNDERGKVTDKRQCVNDNRESVNDNKERRYNKINNVNFTPSLIAL